MKKKHASEVFGQPGQVPSEPATESSARRHALRTIVVGGSVFSLTTWKQPIVESVILPAHAQTSPPDEPEGPDLACDATLEQSFCGDGNEVVDITATVLGNVPDGTEIRMTATLNGGPLPNNAAENPRVRSTTSNVADFGDLNVCFPIHQDDVPPNSTLRLFFEFVDEGISTETCELNFDFDGFEDL